MSKSELFAIDIDGVACDHARAICDYVNSRYGCASCPVDVRSWDHDFGPISFVAAVAEAYVDRDFVANMKVTQGFGAFFAKLAPRFDVAFLTARADFCREATARWVEQHFPGSRIQFVRNKALSGAAYLVDDNVDEVVSFGQGGRTAFLLSQPWNNDERTIERLRAVEGCFFAASFDSILAELGL